VTDKSGRWIVSNLSSGRVKIAAKAPGFNQLVSEMNYDDSRPEPFNSALSVGALAQSVTVLAENGRNFSGLDLERLSARCAEECREAARRRLPPT